MSHTKEPWVADDSESTAISATVEGVKYWIADFAGFPGPKDQSGADNRDRAVACVNACAGIPNDAVYHVVAFGLQGHNKLSADLADAKEQIRLKDAKIDHITEHLISSDGQVDELLRILKITRGNIASIGPAGCVAPYTPFREWLAQVDAAIAGATNSAPQVDDIALDTERLNWLLDHPDAAICSDGANGPFHIWFRYSNRTTEKAKTARAAIDAALSIAEGGEA
ncbi:MAG: hypothetical protein KGP14_16610 [Betaproteobacteria bacterium]|nr:hypothetical protein [Betaproteobacteria bacterium]